MRRSRSVLLRTSPPPPSFHESPSKRYPLNLNGGNGADYGVYPGAQGGDGNDFQSVFISVHPWLFVFNCAVFRMIRTVGAQKGFFLARNQGFAELRPRLV